MGADRGRLRPTAIRGLTSLLRLSLGRLRALPATDPGRTRLINASAIAGNVVLSAGITYLLVTFAGYPQDLLVFAGIVGMLSMAAVKDTNPRSRAVTTAFMALPAVAAAVVAASLAAYRIAEIALFILISGVAIWARRYGPRGGALGMIGFFSYFMVLLTRTGLSQLPHLLVVVAVTIGSALTVRLLLLRQRPRRQITLLIHQFRGASASAILAAVETGADSRRVGNALRHLDTVALAISDWQHRFTTSRHFGATAEGLARQVFDAQISVEQSCSALGSLQRPLPAPAAETLEALDTALSNRVGLDVVEEATDRAVRRVDELDLSRPGGVTSLVLARNLRMQRQLYAGLHAEPLGDDPEAESVTEPEQAPAPPPQPADEATPDEATPDHRDWHFWRSWAPTSRMAVQVVIATALATGVGEAISATRWYWAVLTAFIVFVGTTTRAGILTRAWNRVWGTVIGVGIGALVVYLIDHHVFAELVLGVVCVFFAFYFGPLRYAWLVLFITIMLASLFDLLGVLTAGVLEVRIEETVVGSVIGVACAYLVFSSRSRPVLIDKTTEWFAALQQLLDEIGIAATRPDHTGPVLRASRDLDRALVEVETAAATMSVASIGPHVTAKSAALHLRETTRSARQLGEAALALTAERDELFTGVAADRIDWAIGHTKDSAELAREVLVGHRHDELPDTGETLIMHLIAELDLGPQSRAGEAVLDLSRLNRTLLAVARMEPGAGWHLPHWLPAGGRTPVTAPR